MPKTLDPNHLALMKAVRTAVEDLRRILQSSSIDRDDLTAICDRLRLTLKGRIGS